MFREAVSLGQDRPVCTGAVVAPAAGQEVDVSTMLSSFPLSLAGMKESHGTSSEEVKASTYSDKPEPQMSLQRTPSPLSPQIGL